ncbi:ABC transporter substrate-binding protein, partial [Paenibacillus selenitireducens]
MSKKRFKTMAGILAVVLLAGSVMGCTGKKEETASKEGTTTTTTPEKKQKISMMYPLYNNPPKKTEVWKAMEEKLNIEYEPMAIPSAQYNDKLLASIAANDLADITHYTGFPDPKFT